MKGRLALLLSLAISSTFPCDAQLTTYEGKKVTYLQFPVVGGEKISLPVTDDGPVPAETADFKVEAAGIALRDVKTNPAFSWGFTLTVKSAASVQRVKIARVYPDTAVKVLVDDQAPAVTAGTWRGSSAWLPPNPQTTPWLLDKGSAAFVFRITVSQRDHDDAVLYQLSVFDESAKLVILKAIAVMEPELDSRKWKAGYDFADDTQRVTEFVMPPETVDSWSELVTHQIVLDRRPEATVAAFVEAMRRMLTSECKNLTWSVLDSTDAGVTYEWSQGRCGNEPAQYEISRVTRCPKGLCRWAYATKRVPVEKTRADAWREILERLSLDDGH